MTTENTEPIASSPLSPEDVKEITSDRVPKKSLTIVISLALLVLFLSGSAIYIFLSTPCENDLKCLASQVLKSSEKINDSYSCGLIILPNQVQNVRNCAADINYKNNIKCYLNYCNSDSYLSEFLTEKNVTDQTIIQVIRISYVNGKRELLISEVNLARIKCINNLIVNSSLTTNEILKECV